MEVKQAVEELLPMRTEIDAVATGMVKLMLSAQTYWRRDIGALTSAMRIMLSRCCSTIG